MDSYTLMHYIFFTIPEAFLFGIIHYTLAGYRINFGRILFLSAFTGSFYFITRNNLDISYVDLVTQNMGILLIYLLAISYDYVHKGISELRKVLYSFIAIVILLITVEVLLWYALFSFFPSIVITTPKLFMLAYTFFTIYLIIFLVLRWTGFTWRVVTKYKEGIKDEDI